MTFVIPAVNWTQELYKAIAEARPGDVIRVDSREKSELARRALTRTHKQGVIVEVSVEIASHA